MRMACLILSRSIWLTERDESNFLIEYRQSRAEMKSCAMLLCILSDILVLLVLLLKHSTEGKCSTCSGNGVLEMGVVEYGLE